MCNIYHVKMLDTSETDNNPILKNMTGTGLAIGQNYSRALMSIGEKSMIDPPPPNNDEVALLIVTATVGMIGNLGILIVILVLSSLRRASNAFLFHQSALDLVKSAYCLPFAQTMVNDQPPSFCSIMGGSYIVFVTTSAFNLLGIVMNESYQFADLMMGIKDSRNYCCVIFGIFMIWFTSIIMNLGVAFIPGNPSFDREMGHCIFVYGITRNYVLHMLWIVLITMALALTSVYLRMLYLDIKRSSYYRMTTLIRATVSIDTSVRTASQRRQSYQREKHHVKRVLRITRKKLYLLISLTAFFILFWYPLFTLTAIDPGFDISPEIYKTVTIVAWCNPTVTPIILFFFIKTVCCCRDSDHVMTLLAEGLPEEAREQEEEGQGAEMIERDSKEDQEEDQERGGGEYCNEDVDEYDQERHYHPVNNRGHNVSSVSSISSPGGAVGGCSPLEASSLLSSYQNDEEQSLVACENHNRAKSGGQHCSSPPDKTALSSIYLADGTTLLSADRNSEHSVSSANNGTSPAKTIRKATDTDFERSNNLQANRSDCKTSSLWI